MELFKLENFADIKIGDFINLKVWFGDVWAEVLHTDGERWLNYVRYSKDGLERATSSVWVEDIRYHTKQVQKSPGLVIHAKDYKWAWCGADVKWPHNIGDKEYFGQYEKFPR